MIFDRIMLPAQGRNEDYKFAQTGSITLVASAGGSGGGTAPAPSWLENVIKIDPESGYLSVQDWHVKGNLVLEGQVNQWLAQQLVVDDARIQVNRKQDGAVADSGLVIYDKDSSTEVSRLVYDVNGIWKAGGDRLFTEAYNPKLGGYVAGDYPRKAEDAVVTGAWTFQNEIKISNDSQNTAYGVLQSISAKTNNTGIAGIEFLRGSFSHAAESLLYASYEGTRVDVMKISERGRVGIGEMYPTELLHVAGNGLFTGGLTAGGNVGTSNFVSQMQGWRVTPQGQADFRHIYTDELQAKAFTADISQALVGSDVLTKSVAKLAQNWATTANGATSTIYVEELEGFPGFQVFAVGDRLLLRLFDRSGGGLLIKNIWATVTSYVSTTNNVQRYTITVNSGGATGQTVYAGSMILDYGTPGSGVIERTVLDQQGSPYSRVSTWTTSPDNPANYTLHYQSGNLNGISNAEGWGVYSENSFLTGKLLVGDLTKVGQYMEYAGGLLKIKGRIEAAEGEIGGWTLASQLLYSGSWAPDFGSGSGIKLDAVNNSIMAQYNNPGNSVEMFYRSALDWGLIGKKGNATVFQLGSTNQIAGIAFDDSKLSTKNWELRKDGSFYFGAGGEIEGGLITGVIESSNYDGVHGSSFDLHNGHLLIGDAIRMSGDVSEIHVKDRDTGLDSFKIGDFTLTPTDFAGAGVDVLLSSSNVSTSASPGSYQLNRTVYVSSSGALMTSTSYVSNSLVVGGTYNFHAYLKVVLSQYTLVETVPGYIMSEGFYRRSGEIKMQLKNYNTVVWEQNIGTIPTNGVIPLSIYTSFQAVSPSLQLIITIDGGYEYRQPYDSGTRLYNTTAYISRFDSSSR